MRCGIKQTEKLEQRLAHRAEEMRQRAKTMPPAVEKETRLKLARQAETGAHMSERLRSPGIQPPT
ncbi:hypothetical protein XH92_15045 [Bradyrhizobium sp. CCBAU 53421]|nr:hypothetical protein [Bradyrhizobium sp. CCBAU 53421]QOZ37876.1 hypothetical protein XH92_15045 [Bradyrhizobium sp. CCBAU 53421]